MKTVMIGYIIDVQTDEHVSPGFVQLFLRTNMEETDKEKFNHEGRWFDKDLFKGFDTSLNKVYWVTISNNEYQCIMMVEPASDDYDEYAELFVKADPFKGMDLSFMTEDKFLDLFGNPLYEGDTVDVPEPNGTDDAHSNEFRGTIIAFRGEYMTVQDGDGDCFDIEPERLKKIKE
jgi:hypothetical protein